MNPYEAHLLELARADERLMVLTAENRAALRELPQHLGPRFVDLGICEQTLLGVAAGLAQRGRRPVVHALAAFLTMRAFEFIRTDIGIARLPVILVGGVAGVLSDNNGPTHQAIEDIALMRAIPGMTVAAPMDHVELGEAVTAALAQTRPIYIRFYDATPEVEHREPYRFGAAEPFGNGQADIAIFTYGCLVSQALEAQRILAGRGLDCCVFNVRTVEPLDVGTLLDCARRCRLLVIVEDHFRVGGLFSAMAEELASANARASLLALNLGHEWFQAARLDDVLEHTGLSGARIADAVVSKLEMIDGRREARTVVLPVHRPVECDLG